MSKSVPEKKDDEEESELEPLNGEVMEDTVKVSLKPEENTAHNAAALSLWSWVNKSYLNDIKFIILL